MNPVNRVVFCRREYPNKEDLYAAIAQQIKLLLEGGYTIVASKEDKIGDGIAIDYSICGEDSEWPKPFWLMYPEYLAASDEHINGEVANAKKIIASAESTDKLVEGLMKKMNKDKDGNKGGGFDA